MSTAPLTKYWIAQFTDGEVLRQPENDFYSKYDHEAEWNPSAFRDVLEYPGTLERFRVDEWGVNLLTGMFFHECHGSFSLEKMPLTNRELIYYRETRFEATNTGAQNIYVRRYAFGYKGKDEFGKSHEKVIFING